MVRVLVGETSRNLSSYQNVGSWVSETVNTASRHQRQATVGYRLVSLQPFQGSLKATLTSPDRVLRAVYRGRRRRHQEAPGLFMPFSQLAPLQVGPPTSRHPRRPYTVSGALRSVQRTPNQLTVFLLVCEAKTSPFFGNGCFGKFFRDQGMLQSRLIVLGAGERCCCFLDETRRPHLQPRVAARPGDPLLDLCPHGPHPRGDFSSRPAAA